MARKIIDSCSEKEGSTADDVAKVVAHQIPASKGEKCLHACIGESLGLVRILQITFKLFLDLREL